MKPRSALIIAAVLTTFVLVLVGAVINRLIEPSPAELAAAADLGAPPALTSAPVEPTAEPPSDREAAYQQQLAEANARIEQANQELTHAYDQLAQPASPAVVSPPAEPFAAAPPAQPIQISSEQAVAAAIAYLGDAPIKEVNLETEHGALVYKVRFESGSKVYIDPASGRVVYAETKDRDSGDDAKADDDK